MPEAPRLWVKLDAGFYDDPRLMGAGERGELLFLRSLAWSRRNLTDGWLPPGVVERLMARRDSGRRAARRRWDAKPNGTPNA
jgi:hypothetical protein